MTDSGWVVRTQDGRSRIVDNLEEAKSVRDDLNDLGLDVEIERLEDINEQGNDMDEATEFLGRKDQCDSESEISSPSDSIIRPISIDDTLEMYEDYDDLKSQLINEDDIQEINGDGRFIKKSGWRKIATAFNLDIEIIDYSRSLVNGILRYTVKARSTAPNGKTATAIAIAQSTEPKFTEIVKWKNKAEETEREEFEDDSDIVHVEGAYRRVKPPEEVNEHDLITLAATRAKNRAISDLVGGGEISAEEIR